MPGGYLDRGEEVGTTECLNHKLELSICLCLVADSAIAHGRSFPREG
jgi:hypothetical protein